MTLSDTGPHWSRLLRMGRALIGQVNSRELIVDHWTLGGGTALMLHIEHRESRDIDVFLRDPQHLALLNPDKNDFQLDVRPSGHCSDGTTFLKLAFENLGEIDFIVAGALTSNPATRAVIDGQSLLLETVSEIIAKKVFHRGSAIKPRDIFDIAASGETHRDAIVSALQQYQDRVSQTLSALEKIKPDFVRQAILQLAIKPAYERIATTARERAIEILRASSQ